MTEQELNDFRETAQRAAQNCFGIEHKLARGFLELLEHYERLKNSWNVTFEVHDQLEKIFEGVCRKCELIPTSEKDRNKLLELFLAGRGTVHNFEFMLKHFAKE